MRRGRGRRGSDLGDGEGGVGPVSGGEGRAVLPRGGPIEHRQQLEGVMGLRLQEHHRVRAVPGWWRRRRRRHPPVKGVEDEVAMEVSGVEARQGEAVPWVEEEDMLVV